MRLPSEVVIFERGRQLMEEARAAREWESRALLRTFIFLGLLGVLCLAAAVLLESPKRACPPGSALSDCDYSRDRQKKAPPHGGASRPREEAP